MSTPSHKSFPPGLGQLQVPVSSKAAALAGISMYTPCRPKGRLAHRVAWAGLSAFGPAVLPGRSCPLRLPVSADRWLALSEQWKEKISPFDDIVLYNRLQSNRPGFIALLLQAGNPVAFLKCHPSGGRELDIEAAAVNMACRAAPSEFTAPAVIGRTSAEGWDTLAFEPLPPRLHRPLRAFPADALFDDIARCLHSLPRPAQTPSHWIPSHGDCTPWNLRRVSTGAVVLLDWERASLAPPGSDRVLYAATATAVLGLKPPKLDYPEAVTYWQDRFGESPLEARDRALRHGTLQALEELATP